MFIKDLVRYDADKGQGSGDAKETQNAATGDVDSSEFTVWLTTQPEDVQKLYTEHIHGLTSALKKEREAAGSVPGLKKKLSEFATQQADAAKAQMAKEDLLTSELATSKAEAQANKTALMKLRLETAVERQAARMNFVDPTDALKLLSDGDVTIDEDGTVKGADTAVAKLAKAKPHLLIAKSELNSSVGSFTGTQGKSIDGVKPSVPATAKL
jgi:hypothetical protein